MSKLIVPKDNICFTSSKEVSAICENLFQKHQLNFFDFCRIFDDGQWITLTSNQEFTEYWCQKEYKFLPTIERTHKSTYHLTSKNRHLEHAAMDVKERFNVNDFFLITQPNIGYIDIFGFGAPESNKEIINFYMNNIDLLKKFGYHFREKAKNLIKLATNQKLTFSKRNTNEYINWFLSKNQDLNNELELLEKTYLSILDIVYFSTKKLNIQLSKREMECLTYILLGFSTKCIAKKLDLSSRTIEFYFQNIKNKLACNTREEVLKIIYHG